MALIAFFCCTWIALDTSSEAPYKSVAQVQVVQECSIEFYLFELEEISLIFIVHQSI